MTDWQETGNMSSLDFFVVFGSYEIGFYKQIYGHKEVFGYWMLL